MNAISLVNIPVNETTGKIKYNENKKECSPERLLNHKRENKLISPPGTYQTLQYGLSGREADRRRDHDNTGRRG